MRRISIAILPLLLGATTTCAVGNDEPHLTPRAPVGTEGIGNYTCDAMSIDERDGHTLLYESCHLNHNPDNKTSIKKGPVDLNGCIGTTPGHVWGGRLNVEHNGCLGLFCHNCSITVQNAKGEYQDFGGPYGNANTSLQCQSCDSSEGYSMRTGTGTILVVDTFLGWQDGGDEEGREARLGCEVGGRERQKTDGGEYGKGQRKATKPQLTEGIFDTAATVDNNIKPTVGAGIGFVGQEARQDKHGSDVNSIYNKNNGPATTPGGHGPVCAALGQTLKKRFAKRLSDAGCHDIILRSDETRKALLQATCPEGTYPTTADASVEPTTPALIKTEIDLDKCLMNKNGHIAPARDGGFSGSCGECHLSFGKGRGGEGEEVVLGCACAFDNGKHERRATLDLANVEIVQVVAGALACLEGQGDYLGRVIDGKTMQAL